MAFLARVKLIAMIPGTLLTLSFAVAAQDPNRIVTAVDDVAKTFSCRAKTGGPSWPYKTTNKTVYRTAGARVQLKYIWHKGSFSEIKVGRVVTVRYHLDGDDRVAERVSIRPEQ